MRKCIAALEKVGHIRQIFDGRWLFKALLAAKPHQEHVRDIDKFVWRFCVNYIPLNSVTRIIAYPIPRCDLAINEEFGMGQFYWLFDAPMGYHQLAVATESQEKLAFQGPDAIKWTYTVMPFGPTNGPATFINFIHDVDSQWKLLAQSLGVVIDDDTNTKIIVDDIFSWAKFLEVALLYIECQLRVCQSYRLSLSLRKSHIFPKRFEFVGIDVCSDGNRPAMSKHQLLQHWPQPDTVRDVAKLIGFAQFYSKFIPHFELRIAPLHGLTTNFEYTELVAPHWSAPAQASFDDIKQAILSDPCLKRFNHQRLIVLRTDFSSQGFGYVVCQPGNDDVLNAAMNAYRRGSDFSFMAATSSAVLHPVAFGARRSRGNEVRLHSHLGEGFAGDWAINKCRHMLFGQRFVWATDCYAIKFILSYDGTNPAILRLQMCLMGWDVDIIHRNDNYLVDADYWSRLGADLCFDPLFKKYLELNKSFRSLNPAPSSLPMLPENMPYFRGPRITSTSADSSDNAHCQAIVSTLLVDNCHGLSHLSNTPIHFGEFEKVFPSSARSANNDDIPCYAQQILQFNWAVYSFNGGHFASTTKSRNLPFHVKLACDPYESGRSLFQEFTSCKQIFSSVTDLLNHIRASGDTSVIHGYLIHSNRYQTSETTSKFWQLQTSIISQLRLVRSLSIVVAVVHPDNDGRSIKTFSSNLKSNGWVVSSADVSYPDFGDSITGSCRLILGIHSSCAASVEPLLLKHPPAVPPRPLARFLWEPFNRPEHSISLARDDPNFVNQDGPKMTVTSPMSTPHHPGTVILKYHIHRAGSDVTILSGSDVISVDGLCPAFNACPNSNIFQTYFGVEFSYDGHSYIRAISPFEFVRCHGFIDQLSYRLSQPPYKFSVDSAMPALTSAWLLEQIHAHLVYLRDSNCEIFSPNQFAAPAATIQAFVNGAIGVRLPSHERWVQAYSDDKEMCIIRDLVQNPTKINTATLNTVNYNFRAPLRQSLIFIENELLFYKEPIRGGSSYTRLQLVPREFYNIIFIAFHSNPIGGHMNAYRTLHRLRPRYYWPGMYSYIKRMCDACPGCALSNPTKSKSSELVYNFPIEAPFLVLFVDAYSAGKHASFDGSEVYLIACCGMTGFASMEPIQHANSKNFASAIMKIQLRYGFCHTIVLDKDSKFFGVCSDALDLLQINRHVLSGDNHNPMMVERVNRYLNKGLKIMTNERDSVRIALEAILLLLYAWNSCPIPGTDISRSLVAVGREFAFPIDYSTNKHWELTSSPSSIESYSKDLTARLAALREVAQLLVQEHRTHHRELINSRRPNPRIYSIGNIVFARRAVRSDASKGRVDKLSYPFTGPWRITASHKGASYDLEHCNIPTSKTKKHASDLSPYPLELVPFEPVDGPDNRFGQLHKPITSDPYKEAGIKGFTPPKPFKAALQFLTTDRKNQFHWPSLSELNDDLVPFQWSSEEERAQYFDGDSISSIPIMHVGPPPAAPVYDSPTVPSISTLTTAIIKSADKLFFISNRTGTNDARKWRLVRIAFQESMSLYPSCLQDGRFLVEFYICHPADCRFNAINQRFWLQYHTDSELLSPLSTTDTHLIRPSDTSVDYANRHKLTAFRKWVNLTHHDTFIHGPFDFSSINGRKTRDRVSQQDWDVLKSHCHMFHNPLPRFDVPSYSIHVDRGAHVLIHDAAITCQLILTASHASAPSGLLLPP